MKKFTLFVFTMIILISHAGGGAFADEGYKMTRWDKVAKNVLFTVTQESRLKALLNEERIAILEARSDAAEKVLKTLDEKQRAKWDSVYQKADKDKSYTGFFRKRQLINPLYLESDFNLNAGKKKILFYVYWDYCRKVESIRAKYREKVAVVMSGYQMDQWDREIHRPLEQEARRNEKRRKAEMNP